MNDITIKAGVIGLCLAASATPSPLYKLYASAWEIPTSTLTLVYAAYCLGVLAALLLFGRISDSWGRRPAILAGLAGLLVSLGLFLAASGVGWLFVARGLQGLATGVAISAAGAALLDLRPAAAGLLNTLASGLGVGVGGLLGAVLVEYAPAPLLTPFAVLAAVDLLLLAGVRARPETVGARAGFRMAAPGVPKEILGPFVLSGLGVTSSWSIVGLYLALVPALAPALMGSAGNLPGGMAIFVMGTAAALAPVLARRLPSSAGRGLPVSGQLSSGMLVLAAGVALLTLSISAESAAGFVVSSVVIGLGGGLGLGGSLGLLGAAAPPEHRARVMSAFYVVAYAAISLPAIGAGFAVRALGPVATFRVFGLGIVVVALVTFLLARARRGYRISARSIR
ncbi:MFS transporter [Nonomuraea sp. WAC 01424]|uniref:MFS transporter n=1 Tax=Nonomuraea sp. WAC 01424 TaxID=2203200 RepID=UPI000F79CF2B|nr:MFS transporter [Nonomuraea sp. WAC 01424]RSN14354.1 MFS transporter [Nonomuraea sp. WAC 01424]